MKSIYDRLDAIIPKLQQKKFRENNGLGNEIGFYIFDYEPKYEMLVQNYISDLKKKFTTSIDGFKIKEFDLYEIMLEILEAKGYVQKNIEMEATKGSDYIIKATKKALRLTEKSDLIVNYIRDRLEDDDIVFLTGVGKAYPIIRSHTILNNLHSVVKNIPLVMFFPGTYSGLELIFLDELKDDNYYRAFKLVERY